MKVCLLFLSVLTLFQLHSGHIASVGENVWLPNLDKLSSIIHICEHELAFKRPRQLPISIPISIPVSIPSKPRKSENVKINSRISINSDRSNGPPIVSLANVDVNVNKNAVSVSHSVDVDKNRDELLIPSLRTAKGGSRPKPGPKPGPKSGPRFPSIKIKPTIELPLDRLISGGGGGNQAAGMARSPLAPPLSNVVTVNNLNKQDDALRSLGLRSQAADDISPRHLVAKLPFRRIFRQKEKYKNIAQCVKLRLTKAYEEEIAFYD